MEKQIMPDRPWAILWKYAKLPSFGILIITILNGVILPINTKLLQIVIDRAMTAYKAGKVDLAPFFPPLLMLAGCLLLRNIKSAVEEFLEILLGNYLRPRYQHALAQKISKLKYEVFENDEMLNIMSRVSSNPAEKAVSWLFLVTGLLSQCVSAVGVFCIISELSVWLIIPIILLFLLFLGLDYKSVMKQVRQSYEQTEDARRKAYYEDLLSSKESAKEIRSGKLQKHLLRQWDELQQKLQMERYQLEIKERVRNHGTVRFLMFLVNTIELILFSFWVSCGIMTVGQLVSIQSVVSSVLQMAMWSFPKSVSELLLSRVYWQDYARVQSYPEYHTETDTYSFSDDPVIEFQDVTFIYPGTEKPILRHLFLRFRLHEKIALVGENGCGKSTLIKLLLGMYEPTDGKILVDGIPISHMSGKQKREFFSFVFQDSVEYQLSIKEAIGIANVWQMDEEHIRSAAKQGGIAEYIETLPQGYHTLLGNRYKEGVELSGGQWQRIAIARSYMTNSKMKILDEPTAALDPRAESELYEEMLRLNREGILIVTHRLGITRHVDRVILLHGGKVEEDGQHEELMQKGGEYQRMYESQSAWYGTQHSVGKEREEA